MINDASVVIGGGNWGIKEADVLGYKLINSEYYARDIDFANSTAAGTYTDSTGVIRKAPYNLLTWSEQFDNAAWVKSGVTTVTPNVEVAPNGTLTADRVQFGTNTVLAQSTSLQTGISCTGSIYIKGTAGETIQITAGTNDSGLITLNGSWQRIQTTKVSLGSSFNVNTFSGATARDIFLWGAQLVEGTEALPYFPTTTRLNVPRIDYRNADGSLSTVGRLLLEPQRTNSMLYSQLINSWALKSELTITDNNTISPDGTQSASYIQQTTGGNSVTFQSQTVSVTAGQVQTISFYAKAKEVTSFSFRLGGVTVWSGGVRPIFTCDLLTGVITVQTGSITVSSESVGNGWFRFNIVTAPTILSGGASLQTPTGAVISPNSGYGFYLWGVQWEQNATYPTTYIPTTTATVTRNADSASRTGVESWIGQTEGVLFMDVNLDTRQSYTYFAVAPNLASTTTYIGIGIASNLIQAEVVNSGVQVAIVSGNSATGRFKIAFAYKQNDFAFYINGALIGTDTSGTVPACSQIGLYNYSQVQILKYNQVAIFPTRLTNEQLSQLTTL